MADNETGNKNQDYFFEQYKLYVEMADRVSQRRDQSSRFYATLFSALAAILVLAARFNLSDDTWGLVFLITGLVGAVLACIWYMNIHSYRTLNSAKFQIINKMEKQLPFQGYTKEWELLRPTDSPRKYLQLTVVEQYVSGSVSNAVTSPCRIRNLFNAVSRPSPPPPRPGAAAPAPPRPPCSKLASSPPACIIAA